ncbi:MAG: hypothetical protein HY819_10655 [Acidobacteria bacterium]|nr:hypothetical protein [Acidobacteriota bacterium]
MVCTECGEMYTVLILGFCDDCKQEWYLYLDELENRINEIIDEEFCSAKK